MKGGKDFETYKQVPGGSRLEVKVGGDLGTFNTDGHFVSSTDVVHWMQGDLIPGPAVGALAAMRAYFVQVRLAFLAKGEAVIEAQIIRPDGSVHSEPCVWKVQGQNGQTAIRGLFIHTI